MADAEGKARTDHDIYLHVSNDLPVGNGKPNMTEQELEQLAAHILSAFVDLPEMKQSLLDKLHLTDPFNRNPEIACRIAERLRQCI